MIAALQNAVGELCHTGEDQFRDLRRLFQEDAQLDAVERMGIQCSQRHAFRRWKELQALSLKKEW
jgi:hypothetical protein